MTRFTQLRLRVELSLLPGVDHDAAAAIIERAERGCLIANSLTAARAIEWHITTVGVADPLPDAAAVH